MKKVLFITPVLFVLNGFSQNQIQQNFNNINLTNRHAVQMQSVQVFASNIKVNDNNTNKPVRANANPQVYVQRSTNANSIQRRQRRTAPQTNINISNVNQPLINISENNINDDIQIQGNFSQQLDNNVGNAFGNENIIEQLASVNIPAIQLGNGLDLNLDINLPKINLPTIKFNNRKSVSSSKHKTFYFKKKLAKFNRKISGKLSFRKKLKIRVDNCFKW